MVSTTNEKSAESPTFVIQPSRGWAPLNLKELWAYRELLYFLTWRDVKVRYKQTALGASWAIIQPFFTMVVFSVVFGQLAKMPSDGVPYPIFAFCALVPWQLFAFSLNESSNSLVGNRNLLTKVYFPRLVIPFSAILAGLVDFLIAGVVLVGMIIYFGIVPGPQILLLPFLVLLAVVTALGVGLWLSALNVEFRDVRYAVPFLVQFWFFATPIAYPSSIFPEPFRTLSALNPMAGVVEGFRWALLRTETAPGPLIAVSAAAALIIFVTGAFYFKRIERHFADVV
ncbi:MAG: ABC transporter permease [Euryarchaeota archaeon]|nr:ABC transporter permease [Euryarchaeota archaeon]